ncbi:hypothetical protein E6R60_26580 [Streptomyces sp. A0642]|uniref:hypothetical protein n=1 Tax=Streptomyces sp. A0642 TaxID=2563100 RepID=UPI0010A27761|nr:hypothetical protein [Streptomyces sp. A0642]THA72499.1 hypothetical protein E6R60_26580 [Streptomyces sp. A0642]
MTVKTPNAAQVSKILKAAGFTKAEKYGTPGFKVTRESGGRIDFNLNQSMGARFPVALVNLPAEDADRAVETLTSAGYHAEKIDTPTRHGGRVHRVAVVVRSQEDIDDRAAREERAANAEAEAEKLVPRTARVTCRLTRYPSHEVIVKEGTRAQVLEAVASNLRKVSTNVLDADEVTRAALAADWTTPQAQRDRMSGLYLRTDRGGCTLLLIPVGDEEQPAPAEPDTEGGPVPAEEFTPEQVKEAREMAREEFAKVDTVRRAPTDEPYAVGTRICHAAQQWATPTVAPKGTAVVVGVGREYNDGTREYTVMIGEDFSRRLGPDNPMTHRTEWNSDRIRFVAPPRFTVKRLGDLHGVWDADTEQWCRTGAEQACQEGTDGLNAGLLTLDTLGRIAGPQGPFEVKVFSQAPECKPSGGVACIFKVRTYEEATRLRDQENAKPNQYAGIYDPVTGHPVRPNSTH